ncbi:sensor histidine kinase [Thiohalomonas denitrificans]|uniref:histidine kinase n=1 Tax=Thiohalomonas denitrificans TaxID=415747 RepID=A0A1G5PKB4_9GAMM|nr:ATP-binding protein [Thiohalomonas denitrificans]SCZ49932.1 Signal transduction histidine kinase [Thiohalomonas denitrificans]
MSSLRRRLDLGLGISLVLLFLIQWGAISLFTRDLVESYVEERLFHDAEGILALLEPGVDGQLQLSETAISPVYRRPFSGHYYQLEMSGREFYSRSLWDDTLQVPQTSVREQAFEISGPQDQPLIAVAGRYQKGGETVRIIVAEDLSPLAAPIRGFQLAYGLVTLAALIGLLLIQRRLVQRGLAPLVRLRRQVSRLNSGELDQLATDVPEEIRPLVDEINHLLTVTGKRLQRSRDALGNLTHALKNPLSHLNQIAGDPTLPLPAEDRTSIHRALDTITQRIDRELRRARVAGAGRPGQLFRPVQDLPPLVNTIERLHRGRQLDVDLSVSSRKAYPLDRDDMLELFGNLIDNATKWAQHRVRISLAESGNVLEAVVEDDGPGCPPDECKALLERGQRLDESSPGHGLGLSIVSAIVVDYGGALKLERSRTLGGLRSEVHFPLPDGGESSG